MTRRLLTRVVAPFLAGPTYRALLYYVVQLVLGVVGFALLIAGWTVTLVLAITPLVVPALIGFRAAVGALAQAQGFTARRLLGASAHPSASSKGVGFWSRGFSVLKDESFWKQQAHLLISWPIALVPLTLLSWAAQTASVPIWYRWVDSDDVFGLFNVDSFAQALPFTAVGLVLLVVLAHLLGPLRSFSRRLANALLAGGEAAPLPEAEKRARRLRALTIDSLVSTGVVLLLIVIWFLTGGYFWPIWPLLALTLVVAIPGWVILVLDRREVARFFMGSEALAMHTGISALVLGFLAASGRSAAGGTSGQSGRRWGSRCSCSSMLPSSMRDESIASSVSSRRGRARSTSRRRSFAGSSATSTTAPRPAWWRSA
jgi:hypothetical protein